MATIHGKNDFAKVFKNLDTQIWR